MLSLLFSARLRAWVVNSSLGQVSRRLTLGAAKALAESPFGVYVLDRTCGNQRISTEPDDVLAPNNTNTFSRELDVAPLAFFLPSSFFAQVHEAHTIPRIGAVGMAKAIGRRHFDGHATRRTALGPSRPKYVAIAS